MPTAASGPRSRSDQKEHDTELLNREPGDGGPPEYREAVLFMGRVLAGAALATLVLTASFTVDACIREMRQGADHTALVAQKERLERIRLKLIEYEASISGLESLSVRAACAGLPLRVPGLPECFRRIEETYREGARGWPRQPDHEVGLDH